ncbi:MAG: cytochrome c1 [Campylobacteraceae bacterium]|jgi:ubiquinol-cytochrome c reductase cytochrome c1 subunit|nr:cytochrome c1 [Campylobacteraceae bacterium]
MRELKILAVLIFFVGLTYWGVEPYAHQIMHPEVSPADFTFKDLPKQPTTGDAAKGKELVAAQCISCHSVSKEGIKLAMSDADVANTYGVVPPDLSNVAAIYDHNFLANFIQNPEATVKAKPGKYAMPNLGISAEDAGHIVAYLSSIANKNLTAKQITEEACVRCHNIKYEGISRVATDARIKEYMGSVPPDLSQVIKSKGEHYLNGFINDPQKLLHGTAMPRVGLTKDAQAKVIEHLEKVGDPKKDERNSLAFWILGYFAILTVLTYLWKVSKFKEVH